ncbi:MAG TPA: hypothetical protein PLK91_08485 [Sphaerochaeta sp.]|jgi:hypothetical protein|nr:hypothetical protein [Spirochaetota bacterium]HOE85235.1 hypothetical protein [Sphaerochaeta sp.]
MKAKHRALLVIVLLTLTLGWVSSSPLVEERRIEEVAAFSTEVVIAPQMRTIRALGPPRWGTHLTLVNDSGYTFEAFDLYNETMQRLTPEAVNLLASPLESEEQVDIDLRSHLLLLNAIAERDGQLFFYTAIDSEGDYYYGEWDPAKDSWKLRITFDSYQPGFLLSQFPIGGETLAVVNRSGKSLEYFAMGDDEVNLLASAVLPTGHRALIPRTLIKDLAPRAEKSVLHYTAYDTDGGWYRGYFYPDIEAWAITIDERMLAGRGDERYTLYVENQLDEAIWFLYAMTAEEFLADEGGDDLLGMRVIRPWESALVDLLESERWVERLADGWEGSIYFIAETNDGDQYFASAALSASNPTMVVNILEERRMRQEGAAENSELVLYNRTGGVLWYLYSATSLDLEEIDLGSDLLGDAVWNYDQYLFLSVDNTEEVARSGALRLYAVDPDGTVYAKSWAIGGERLITFRPDDRTE